MNVFAKIRRERVAMTLTRRFEALDSSGARKRGGR
jgi:hypothetical protein